MVHFNVAEAEENVLVKIFSGNGKLLQTLTIYPGAGQVSTDLSRLPGGLYFLRISTRDKTWSSKLQLIR
jgi:hypothetical protein